MIEVVKIADSIAPNNTRITTFQIDMPRIILAENNTHRKFSRNCQSTRAVPLIRTKKVRQSAVSLVRQNPFVPEFTVNRPGMMSNEVVGGWRQRVMKAIWGTHRNISCSLVWLLAKLGASKQHAGRLLEPHQFVRVVVTATTFDNFFHLRIHPTAQPEIQEVARLMLEAMNTSGPTPLEMGDWHLPYFREGVWTPDCDVPLEDARIISSSCCAQASYRKLDDSLETAQRVYSRLIEENEPVHSSPFEHQATPAEDASEQSGNFHGWVQFRQMIPGNNCAAYLDLEQRFHHAFVDASDEWAPLQERESFDPF